MPGHSTGRTILLVFVVVALVFLPAAGSQSSGQGSGQYRVQTFTELQTVEGSIPPLVTAPTKETPGALAFDDENHFRFNGRWTNTKHAVLLHVAEASGSDDEQSQWVQGTLHQIADWVRIRQDAAPVYGTVSVVGTYVADATSYVVPAGGFDLDSQGTLTIQTYPVASPEDGPTTHTVYWIYDAGRDMYWFDATDPDFTNNNGEKRVYPVASTLKPHYTFTLDGLSYAVHSVAGAGQNYVPTVRLAWEKMPGVANGHDFDAYVLFDFPPGARSDDYGFSIQATIHSLR